MAPWALMKLLHPFTANDILASRNILSSLDLPASTAHFVLALTDSASPPNVVYLLAVEKLSERSIGDIGALVAAVNPSSVVALVDGEYVTEVVEEEELLGPDGSLNVPNSVLGVLKACFTEKIRLNVFESRAGLRVLINIFGTTFYGNVLAAKSAAERSQAVFEYLKFPSTAANSFSDSSEEKDEAGEQRVEASEFSFGERFLTGFSALLGGISSNSAEQFTSASQRVATLSRSGSPSEELRATAVSLASTLSDSDGFKFSRALPNPRSKVVESGEAEDEDCCPSFALPFYPLFLDLHNLFRETPGVNQALNFTRNLLNSVERGEEVDHEDLSGARLFRVAVESVRLCWNAFSTKDWVPTPAKRADFSLLPFEEKCNALLARALQDQARKFGTVVAVVDASSVAGIRRQWNTPLPPEVAAYAEYCFVGLESPELEEGKTFHLLESPETKTAVMVSAGAVAAAGLVSLPNWAPVPTFMKVLSFKVPAVLKFVWIQMKRQAAVTWVKSVATPASKFVLPSIKATASAKSAALPSSAAKAMLTKSAATAEKARAAAQSVVAMTERASLYALRTAFYSVMRNTQARGPRPWLMLGGAAGAAAGLWGYGEEMEYAIGIIPSAPAVVSLGRGLESLERASSVVEGYAGPSWWRSAYETLYRPSIRT